MTMTKLTSSATPSRGRTVAYWLTTALIASELLVGGAFDILRLPPFFPVLKDLGYPAYFSVILGTWKLLGGAAVLAPRFPRLKEWAYAGAVFAMTGAAASNLAAGNTADTLVVPIIFTGLTFASWALRPPTRR